MEAGLKPALGTNLFITGGGSNFFNIDKYCSNFFGSDVKKLDKKNNNESQNQPDPNFTSCLGALEIINDGWETEAIPKQANKNTKKLSFFAKIFGN